MALGPATGLVLRRPVAEFVSAVDTLLVLVLRGESLASGARWAYPGVPPGTGPVASLLAALILNAVGEETGWHGYLLPHLLPLGRVRATVLLAVLWACWHVPAFFLPLALARRYRAAWSWVGYSG